MRQTASMLKRRAIMQVSEIIKQLEIQEGNLKAGLDFGAKSDFITATVRKISELQKALDATSKVAVLAI
jgi:hypothetical protein